MYLLLLFLTRCTTHAVCCLCLQLDILFAPVHQLKQHSIALSSKGHSANDSHGLGLLLCSACHTNQCPSLSVCWILLFCLYFSLSLSISLPVLTLPMSLSRMRNQQHFTSTSTGREETDIKSVWGADAWETAVMRSGRDRVKRQKSMELIGLPWVTACQGVSSCPLV